MTIRNWIRLNLKEFLSRSTYVNEPTHKKGHSLDLIITRLEDELITRIEIKNSLLSDHLAVHCKLRLNKPQLDRTEIQYRKLKSIDMVNSKEHTAHLDLINKYEETLKVLLDTHAPMKLRIITLRPSAS